MSDLTRAEQAEVTRFAMWDEEILTDLETQFEEKP